jgi:hypothetical protein
MAALAGGIHFVNKRDAALGKRQGGECQKEEREGESNHGRLVAKLLQQGRGDERVDGAAEASARVHDSRGQTTACMEPLKDVGRDGEVRGWSRSVMDPWESY